MWLLYETSVGKVKKFNKGYILQTSSKAHISLLNYKNPICSIPKCQISLGGVTSQVGLRTLLLVYETDTS